MKRSKASRSIVWLLWIACATAQACTLDAAEPDKFYLGINLNGPAVEIDGHLWEGHDSSKYECDDKAFENQSVPLIPSTDVTRAQMIRSSRWGGNRVKLVSIPEGRYTVFLYVWEDNRTESYSISVNGKVVVRQHQSGSAGHWQKLGPWYTDATDRALTISSQGGAANFSGIEIWRGEQDGQHQSPISEENLAFFEKRIRPILVNRCYECHSSESKEVQGELLVDSRAATLRGGTNGPAVVPGNLDDSLLIRAIRYQDESLQMPPDAELSELEKKDLEDWIQRGAPDPRWVATKFQRKKIDLTEARKFWSLQPLRDPLLPQVQDKSWPSQPLDFFTLSAMEKSGLRPALPVDKRALIRRASYDLTGLPPTHDEVQAFLADETPQAFDVVIDRLLASRQYAQRWGRYWLDVVRYADTAGDNSDFPIPQMHLYRDWVIDSLDRDMPYHDFVRAQLAGDLLPYASDGQRREQVIATGYIANARRFGSRVDDYPQHLTIEDTLDNFGRAFLGLTINCARCHDHKFDPISAEDYYGLYGIFESTRYPWPGIELEQRQRDLVPMASQDEVMAFEKDKAEKQKSLDAEVKRLESLAKKESDEGKKEFEEQIKNAKDAARVNSQRMPPYELIYGVAEKSNRSDAAVQIKGDPAKPGDTVRRRFPLVLGGQELPEDDVSSGRLRLVDWMFESSNPLPARVMVNRIWQYHFGKGIVPTANDFGKQGKPATHPELLDWLAARFMEDGWSIKSMHRRIMRSKTYQLAGDRDPKSVEMDPGNDWLSSYPRRRLDAESIRDTLLLLGGSLDQEPAGPHPFPPMTQWKFTQHNPFKDEYPTNKRSVYLMTQRIQRHPYLAIFDGADPSVSTASRTTSTTPLQALYLLNDALVHEQAKKFASRLIEKYTTDEERFSVACEQALIRLPQNSEIEKAIAYLNSVRHKLLETGMAKDQLDVEAWQSMIRVLFRLNEFVYLD